MGEGSAPLDLLVVGGGITGAGVARDAALRGLRVGLVERRDFAAGTSSRSSKLIHGGVRYLQLGDFMLVRESASERYVLGRIAPHLVEPIRMVVPAWSRRAHLTLNVGLWTYGKVGSIDAEERHVMWDRRETLAHVPQLRRQQLYGAVAYYESLTDDARLVLDTLKSAHAAGALIANYAEVVALHLEGGRVAGARVRDGIGGTELDVAARVVVNAAGPWVDTVRRLEGPLPDKQLHLTKGIHVTLPRSALPVDCIVGFKAADRRMVFVVPRGAVAYVGTTDTDYGEPQDHPEVTSDDVHYLLQAVRRAFDAPGIGPHTVLSAWAGLRPLIHEEGKPPSEISRRDEVLTGAAGLLSIAGGKLTTYRRMAARIVDSTIESLERLGALRTAPLPCRTDQVPLAGGGCPRADLGALASRLADAHPAVAPGTVTRLVHTYGTESETILELVRASPDLGEPVAADTDLLRAEIHYGIEHELALGIEDILERRTRALLFATDQGLGAVERVAEICVERFGWSGERSRADMDAYRALARSLRPQQAGHEGETSRPAAARRAR
jgi:glycerol-3-phosphate dehydrogenase